MVIKGNALFLRTSAYFYVFSNFFNANHSNLCLITNAPFFSSLLKQKNEIFECRDFEISKFSSKNSKDS